MSDWTPERHERFEHIKTRHRMGHEQELIEMLDDALREIKRLEKGRESWKAISEKWKERGYKIRERAEATERTAALWKKTVDEGEEILHAAEARVKELEEESKLNADHMLEQRRLLQQRIDAVVEDMKWCVERGLTFTEVRLTIARLKGEA